MIQEAAKALLRGLRWLIPIEAPQAIEPHILAREDPLKLDRDLLPFGQEYTPPPLGVCRRKSVHEETSV